MKWHFCHESNKLIWWLCATKLRGDMVRQTEDCCWNAVRYPLLNSVGDCVTILSLNCHGLGNMQNEEMSSIT